MSINRNGTISPAVCGMCGAMYLMEFATHPAYVCGTCGYGGFIMGTAAAAQRKKEVEAENVERRKRPGSGLAR